MVSAIFGLVGVIIGGIITTGTQIWLERQRRNEIFRRAKRLVAEELLQHSSALRILATENVPLHFPDGILDRLLPTEAWETYRADLSATVDDELWNQLSGGYQLMKVHKTMLEGRSLLAGRDGEPDGDSLQLRETMKNSAERLRDVSVALTGTRREL